MLCRPFGTNFAAILYRFFASLHPCLWSNSPSGFNRTFSHPWQTNRPLTTFKVACPVRYVSGIISDSDDKGVEGATVSLLLHAREDMAISSTTDAEGYYIVRLEEGGARYSLHVTAPGHTAYEDDVDFYVTDNPVKNYKLYSRMTYPAGKRSTIILPVPPDATAGRYYTLSRRDGKTFIFERVLAPMANVPYVLFAERDYHVDLGALDLSAEPYNIRLDEGLSFVGTYTNGNYPYSTAIVSIDLDEGGAPCEAMHAHLVGHYELLHDNDYEMVFSDMSSAISSVISAAEIERHSLFDLQGRRLTTQPRRGLYIKDGKKIVVK